MRKTILFLCFMLAGCTSHVTQKEVADATGNDRLLLVDERTQSVDDYFNGRTAFDFDSLKWQTKTGGTWSDRLVISRSVFQGKSPRTRWVSDIQSINPTAGTAIIKVAEGDVPANSPSITYVYSWREWDLLSNSEVRTIRTCKDPFERY